MVDTARRRTGGLVALAALLVGLAAYAATRTHAQRAMSLGVSLVTDDASTVPMMDDGAPVDDALVVLADDALATSLDDDGAAAAPSSLANDRPDIVLITLDDVGVNDLWGSVDLPALKELGALATNGVLLGGYHGQSYCSPARASLLSGKFVHRIGFSDQDGGKRELTAWSNFSVPLGHELLPETMKRLGYATHGIGKWNIGHCNELYVPWNRGFDSWLGYFSDGVGYTSHLADQDSSYSLDGTQYDLYDMAIYDKEANSISNGTSVRGTYTTSLFNARAESLLMGTTSAAPLFLWLAHHGMHDNDGVDDAETCDESADDDDEVSLFAERASLTDARFKFACGLRAVDRGVGVVKQALDDRPRDYVLAVISDNGGDACGAHCAGSNFPLRGQKFFEFDGGVKVPALVYSPTLIPAARRGQTFDGLFHHVDWLATFMDAAGGHQSLLDPNYDSVSQWEFITGKRSGAARDTIVFAASAQTAAIRSGDYKFLYRVVNGSNLALDWNGTEDTHFDACEGGVQLSFLFDVKNDPNELVDLSGDERYNETLVQLHAIWKKVYETEFWTPSSPFGDTSSEDSPAAVAFQKNGGYVTHWGCDAMSGNL